MDIEILKNLKANPKRDPNSSESFENKPYTISEIEALELLYNNNNPFPKALREYLFLAGRYCWLLGGSKEEQIALREQLAYFGLEITRPFYVLYYDGETFDIVYLDEEEDDPKYYMSSSDSEPATEGGATPEIKYTGETLSERIEKLILSFRNALPD